MGNFSSNSTVMDKSLRNQSTINMQDSDNHFLDNSGLLHRDVQDSSYLSGAYQDERPTAKQQYQAQLIPYSPSSGHVGNHSHSKHVKSFVLEKIETIDDQIKALQDMRATLSGLAARCHGDEGSKCAIIEGLADSFGKQS